ncbi:WD repeat- and FYVE domain-containing protein 4 [Varanus komodoensis]|nr:WD repeat- and FYVE domain-containing protein 4 [Varanus komodoensis]
MQPLSILGKMPSNVMCRPVGNVHDCAVRNAIACGHGQLYGLRLETLLSQKACIKRRRIAATVKSPIRGKVQFRCSELLVTGQWQHLVVTVAKETKRICTTSAYINGRLVGSAKMQYIQPLPGGFVSMDPSSFVDVYGYVATPPIWKAKSSLTWRQGPLYFLEEVISMDALLLMVKLGPRYCSNFQAVELRGAGVPLHARTVTLVSQENISFGISVMSSSYTTVKDIRDCYGEVDGRLIAKELGLSSRDGTTPVFLVQNTAGKLPGTLRTIGAVTVGQDGTRVFQSCPAAVSLNYIGGPAVLLGLLAVACDDHAVYAAIKVLHSVLSSSAMSENLMKHISGYQMLAYLLKKKTHLLNSRILQLVLSMGGIAETSLDSPTIKNSGVFRHIICDFETRELECGGGVPDGGRAQAAPSLQ